MLCRISIDAAGLWRISAYGMACFWRSKCSLDGELMQLITNIAPQMSPTDQNFIPTSISSDRALNQRSVVDYDSYNGRYLHGGVRATKLPPTLYKCRIKVVKMEYYNFNHIDLLRNMLAEYV